MTDASIVEAAPLHYQIDGRAGPGRIRSQIAWASSVNVAARLRCIEGWQDRCSLEL